MNQQIPELYGVYILSSVIGVLLFSYILTYLKKLETIGCKCALDWKRNYIIFYCIFTISISLIDLFLLVTRKTQLMNLMMIMVPINIVLSILFVVTTLQYTHRLKREKCNCSEDLGRTIMYIVALVDAAVFAVAFLMILISIIRLRLLT